jgi:AI-2E family transporter
MTSPGLSAATPRRWGLPRGLIVLLGGAAMVMVIVVIVYCAINFVVQSIIQPRFIGGAVGLSVTVTFLALVFWAWLIGPLGAILAIPLTLLAKAVLVDVDPHAGWADALLRASATKPEPPAAEATAEVGRSPADTELAAAPVPSPQVEEPGPPSREPTTHVT